MNGIVTETGTPLVSILINNYNYGRFLSKAIDSALCQTYRNVEVIVVDDGSTDNSREIIAGYGKKIIPVLKENGGQASAFNAGFAASKGEIICFLDSDDFYEANKLCTIVDAFFDNPECGFIVHKMHYIGKDYNKVIIKEHENIVWTASGDYRSALIAGKKNRCILPATSALCFRKFVLEKICPVPDELKITADNYLKFAGLMFSPLVALDDPLSCQRIHGANAYTNQDRNTKQFRKRKREINKGIAIGLYKVHPAQKISDRFLKGNIKSSLVDFDIRDMVESLLLFGRFFIGRSLGR
jgi:glycosyltransferase involved in cell wall biosynthesis